MKKLLIPGLSLLVFLMMPFGSLQAQNGLAVGLKAGTTGFGADAMTSVGKKFNVRVGGTFFSHQLSGVADEGDVSIDYNADFNMVSVPALVDFYPANRGFRITGGFHYHDLSISGGAVPNEPYKLDDNKTFSPEKLGSLSADIGYASNIAPYFGIGFGNALAPGSKLKLSLDLGALYTNALELSMDGTGMISPTSDQAPNFQEGLNEFKFYPVLNLGINFRFMDKRLL